MFRRTCGFGLLGMLMATMKARSKWQVATYCAVFMGLSGPTMAIAHGGNNDSSVVHACVDHRSGDVDIVGVNGHCKNHQSPMHWAIAGPMGSQGPAGGRGPMGPAGPVGATGPAGPAGAPGLMGPAGAAGPMGQQGPQGPQGFAGPTGLQGPSGISGYVIEYNKVAVEVGQSANVHVECPEGKKVLGGGFGVEYPPEMSVYDSGPTNGQSSLSDHAWNVFVFNKGQTGARFAWVYAICANVD
jgi:hypothetical protein